MSAFSLTTKYLSGNNKRNKEQPKNGTGEQLQSETKKESNKNKNLKFSTAQGMIFKLLTTDRLEKESPRCRTTKEYRCTKYTKEELAQKLGITHQELEKLKIPYFYRRVANKISLPLISLYCATKWVNEEYRARE
jgi:hypothetical protein